jgi:CheY-like chemotaxis protein
MHVEQDRAVGLLTFTAVTSEEETLLQDLGATTAFGQILKYKGRGSITPNASYGEHMWLQFSYGEDKKLELLATTEEDEKAVRQLRDAIYFGKGGLTFTGYFVRNGKPSVDFTIAQCKACHKSIISVIECEWLYCDACAAKCEHQYKRGATHGGGVDLKIGDFCSVCGRAKPEPKDEPEKPLYDHHIAVERELGIHVFYSNFPGITPHIMKGLVEGTIKKVLIVEDNPTYSHMIRRNLEDKVLIAQAFTTKEAEAIFQRNPDLAVILMDACVPGDNPNTMWLVKKMRETFTGPIIAISSVSDYRKKLMEAGCNYEAMKNQAAQKVLELIDAL